MTEIEIISSSLWPLQFAATIRESNRFRADEWEWMTEGRWPSADQHARFEIQLKLIGAKYEPSMLKTGFRRSARTDLHPSTLDVVSHFYLPPPGIKGGHIAKRIVPAHRGDLACPGGDRVADQIDLKRK